MLHHAFFPTLSPTLLHLFAGLVVGMVVGTGLFHLSLHRYFTRVEQFLAQRLQEGRRVRLSTTARRFFALMLVTSGVLTIIGMLLLDFSESGTFFKRETVEFVGACVVGTLFFTFVPSLLVRQKRKSVERRLEGDPLRQIARLCHPQPKETREEEIGPKEK